MYSKFTIYKNRACFESLLNQIHHEISWYIDWFLLDYLLTCRLMCKRCMHYCIPITVTVIVFVNVFFLVLFISSDLFYQYYSKYMLLCSTEETKSYRFETVRVSKYFEFPVYFLYSLHPLKVHTTKTFTYQKL